MPKFAIRLAASSSLEQQCDSGLPTIVHLIRSGFCGPLNIEIADGHGRSYGKWTSVLFRSVPGHSISSVPPTLSANEIGNAVLADIGK